MRITSSEHTVDYLFIHLFVYFIYLFTYLFFYLFIYCFQYLHSAFIRYPKRLLWIAFIDAIIYLNTSISDNN